MMPALATDRRTLLTILLTGVLVLVTGSGKLNGQAVSGRAPGAHVVVNASGIFSEQPSTTEGALTLLLPMGAQGVAMGRAMTAMRGPETVFWNPAGLARLEGGRFMVYRGNELAGEATAISLLLARQPLGCVGISYQLVDLGEQVSTDKEGNVLGTLSYRDHLAIASFALEVFPRLDAGINFKVFQSRQTCRGQCYDAGVTGTTYALDAGVQVEPLASIPLRVGAMIAHIGPDLQLINSAQADPLPTRVRVAVAYDVLSHFLAVPDAALWLSAELEDRWHDFGSPVLYLGGELVAGTTDQFFLRAGYGQGSVGQAAGTRVGFGLRYERFELGLAKRLSQTSLESGSEPVYITFGVGF